MTTAAFVAGAVFMVLVLAPIWVAERRRTDNLLRLLESKAAPAEYAAYLAPPDAPDYVQDGLIWSEDGLVSVQAA